MKERFLDIIKWGVILIIAGAVFYMVYPKYYFSGSQDFMFFRGNKITGHVDVWNDEKGWMPRLSWSGEANEQNKKGNESIDIFRYITF